MKKQSLLKISSIIPLIIFTIIFLSSIAQGSESVNDVTSDTTITFNESTNDSEQIDALKDIVHRKIDANKSSSSPELCISLDEKLQWFFSFENPDFIDDPYENKDYYNYRATFGIHIVL